MHKSVDLLIFVVLVILVVLVVLHEYEHTRAYVCAYMPKAAL